MSAPDMRKGVLPCQIQVVRNPLDAKVIKLRLRSREHMDIQQLRYFVTVAEELHFGHAADRLHLTASPLSRRVRELERELGQDLFVREYHQVRLTRFGREFLDAATEVLHGFDALRGFARTTSRPALPLREIGAAPLAPPALVDLVLETFQRLYPDYQTPITLQPSVVLLDKLSARELDLVVVHLPVTAPHLRGLELVRYDFVIAMRADDDLARRPSLLLADLADRQLLTLSRQLHPTAMQGMNEFLVGRGIKHLTELPHDDAVQLATQVRRTRGLTLTLADRDLPVSRIFDSPDFAMVPLDEPDLYFAAGIAWRAEDESTDPVLADVINTLRTGHSDAADAGSNAGRGAETAG
jgi:DNA-binding transcriptional LysR family regulator